MPVTVSSVESGGLAHRHGIECGDKEVGVPAMSLATWTESFESAAWITDFTKPTASSGFCWKKAEASGWKLPCAKGSMIRSV